MRLSTPVGIQSRRVGVRAPIAGTGAALVYSTTRTPGYRSSADLELPVTGPELPDSLKRVVVEVEVAGQKHVEELPPDPNQRYSFVWDGRDGYGRPAEGVYPLTARVGYVYDGVYGEPEERQRSFARFAVPGDDHFATAIEGQRGREELTVWGTTTTEVRRIDERRYSDGGWTLDVHHRYDPIRRTLWLGSGERRDSNVVSGRIETVLGGGQRPATDPDGSTGTDLAVTPTDVVAAPDGSVYVSDWNANVVLRLDTDGSVRRVAGTGAVEYSGDGGPAREAGVPQPTGIDLAPDGSLYVLSWGNNGRVRRVRPDGVIELVAGGGTDTSDGAPALDANLGLLQDVAVGPEGVVYLASLSGLKRITPDRRVETVAAGGAGTVRTDGVLVTDYDLRPTSVAVGPDGTLYVVDGTPGDNRILAVDGSGTVRTVVGGGELTAAPGLRGTEVTFEALAPPSLIHGSVLDVQDDGTLYFSGVESTEGNARLWRKLWSLETDGVLRHRAGTTEQTFGDDGQFGPDVWISGISGLSVAHEDQVYFADSGRFLVRRLAPPFGGDVTSEFRIVSADGQRLYVFDANGRHLRTEDTRSGRTLLTFEYDEDLRLTAVVDSLGRLTVERGPGGGLTGFVAADGTRTAVTVGRSGYVERLVARDETATVTYDDRGLVTAVEDVAGTVSFAYDDRGTLTAWTDRHGAETNIETDQTDDGFTVRVISPSLEETVYTVDRGSDGSQLLTASCCGGGRREVTVFPGRSSTAVDPDGTTTVTELAADPRFGAEVPYVSRMAVETPGGRRFEATTEREAEFAADNSGDVVRFVERSTAAGETFVREYDARARTETLTTPEGRRTTGVFDADGRLVETRADGLAPTRFRFDERGRPARIESGGDGDVRAARVAYDSDGQMTGVLPDDGDGATVEYDYLGRFSAIERPDGTRVAYGYDENRLTSVTPPGRPAHGFTYTQGGRMRSYERPDGESLRYTYDADGRPTRATYPGDESLTYEYEGQRLRSVARPDGRLRFRYDDHDKPVGFTSPDGVETTIEYDGPLEAAITHTLPEQGEHRIEREYDESARVSAVAVDGERVAIDLDADGFLTGVGQFTVQRDGESGAVRGTRLGQVRETVDHTPFGEIATRTVRAGNRPIYAATYEYDARGRVTELTETIDGETTVHRYEYDAVGRLAAAERDGARTTYAYDDNDNLVRVDGPNGTETATYDDLDRLRSRGEVTYEYDATGALAARTVDGETTRFGYTVTGELRSIRFPDGRRREYLHDAGGRRVGVREDGRLVRSFVYDGAAPVAEYDVDGKLVARYVYGRRGSVPEYVERDGRTYALVVDHRRAPLLAVDTASGDVVSRTDYDPFGVVLREDGPALHPFGFGGGLADRDTGLVRLGARDYDPQAGRFTATDPILFAGGSTNLYAYAMNDPVNRIDPTGLSACGDLGGELRDNVLPFLGDSLLDIGLMLGTGYLTDYMAGFLMAELGVMTAAAAAANPMGTIGGILMLLALAGILYGGYWLGTKVLSGQADEISFENFFKDMGKDALSALSVGASHIRKHLGKYLTGLWSVIERFNEHFPNFGNNLQRCVQEKSDDISEYLRENVPKWEKAAEQAYDDAEAVLLDTVCGSASGIGPTGGSGGSAA